MRIPIFQVDAFAEALFTGNPAAVVITDKELPSSVMQFIAAENNLAETAFVFGDLDAPSIRWFTPTVEVDLCGHATLAAAHVILTHLSPDRTGISFSSKSGLLKVFPGEGLLWLDFPADPVARADDMTPSVEAALGCRVESVFRGRFDALAVVPSQSAVENLHPNLMLVKKLTCRGIMVSARGEDVDFVSRFFAPQSGIDEDPVTGSAHTILTPYWSSVLGKKELSAAQLSKRGGRIRCRNMGERVHIGGKAVTFLEGHIAAFRTVGGGNPFYKSASN